MILIGENLNIMSQTIGPALRGRNPGPIQELAKAETDIDYIDLNIGPARKAGDELMEWVVKTVQGVTDKSLSLDTTNPVAMEAGLKVCKGKALINSVSLQPGRLEQGLPLLRRRVGVATGSVVAGCLGSSQRMKYTTIGDTINTAARLETLDKESFDTDGESSNCRILLAESTMKYIQDTWQAEPAGSVVLRGKTKSVRVFRIDTYATEEVENREAGEVIA